MILLFPLLLFDFLSLLIFSPLTLVLLALSIFIILLLQHLFIPSTLGTIMDEQKLRPLPSSFPCCTRPRPLRRMPRFTPQQRVHLPHLPTRTTVYTRSYITVNSHLNTSVYVVAEFYLGES